MPLFDHLRPWPPLHPLQAAARGNADAQRVYRCDVQLIQLTLTGARFLVKTKAAQPAARAAVLQALAQQITASAGRRRLHAAEVNTLTIGEVSLAHVHALPRTHTAASKAPPPPPPPPTHTHTHTTHPPTHHTPHTTTTHTHTHNTHTPSLHFLPLLLFLQTLAWAASLRRCLRRPTTSLLHPSPLQT